MAGWVADSVVSAIVSVVAIWALCVLLCTRPAIQRHIFYLHKLPIWWTQELDIPESFGFLQGQVQPFLIPTSDGCSLFAWLVTPLALYAKRQKDSKHENPLSLLRAPNSLLVIYFHGNAGSVGQTRRTDAYRMVSSGASQRIFVLAFDYRGFGRSTGSPSEAGLTEDALTVIRWANEVGKVPSKRIVLLAQSLGTAVAAAAVDNILARDPDTHFAGVILCAAFTNAAHTIMSYKVGRFFVPLAPINSIGVVRRWFFRSIVDSWNTQDRIARIAKSSRNLHLTFVASIHDSIVPFAHSENLFTTAVTHAGAGERHTNVETFCDRASMGDGGSIRSWSAGQTTLREVLVVYGGHNGIMKWAPVALEVLRSFDLDAN